MKKLILILIILLQMVVYSQFSGGTGTLLDPYHVATAEDLDNIRNYLESSFIQIADIDLGIAPWNVGEGWDPIGDYDWTDPSKSFRGNYNGDGYEIRNMYINNRDGSFVGVFGSSDGVYYQNINIMNFDITSGTHIGGVVGISYNDSISNCITQGFIDGDDFIGLLMGFFEGSFVKDCHVQGDVISLRGWSGGLIGLCTADSIENCSSEIMINSEGILVGGLFGNLVDTSFINECYTYCYINSSREYVGGIFGASIIDKPLEIRNSFSIGEITSLDDCIGGFIGSTGPYDPITIVNCFSNVDVTGKDIVSVILQVMSQEILI